MTYLRLIIAALLLQAVAVLPAAAEKRVALVIGNSAYVNAGTLANPANDAVDVARVLAKFGFKVILGQDLARPAFEEKIREFSHALADADTAVLFYAGHGLQVAGHNYLVPIDAKLSSERDLDFETISLDFVLKQMEVERDGKVNIVFLDACRDNPLSRNLARSMGMRSVSVGKGLAEVQTGVGTFISYSTQPGNVALDGEGRNSPFAGSLVKHVQEPGRNLNAIMIDVRKDVLAASGGRQVPWDHSALTSDFYFQAGSRSAEAAALPDEEAPHPKLGGKTTMADLDALAADQNWSELYGRLTDISPSARDAHWKSLVEQAAIAELEQQDVPGGSAAERFAAIERYHPKFASLNKSAKFLSLRTKVGLEAFSRCFDEDREGGKCRDQLQRFIHGAPVSTELALGAAHLIGIKFTRQAAPPFYAAGLGAPGGSAAICAAPDLQTDLLAALQLPPRYTEAKAAITVAAKCWDSMKSALAGEVARQVGDTSYLQNMCGLLIQHESLKGLLEKRCKASIANKK